MKKLTKILIALFFTFGIGFSVQAAGIVLSPPKFEFTGNPGDVISGIVKITNKGNEVLILDSDTQDFIAGGETGRPSFVSADKNEHSSLSLAKWIDINGGEKVEVGPGEKKEIPFKINIPENAEPGGHYGSIFFFPPAGKGQVAVVQKIGSLILVKVNGEIRKSGELLTFGAFDKKITGEEIEKSSSKSFYTNLPVNFSVRFKNTGNIHLKPSGKVEIFGTFGNQIKPIGVKAILTKKGVKTGDEIVDFLPVNDGNGNVLADSTRRFDVEFKGKPFWYKNEDGTKVVKYKGGVENYSDADFFGKVKIFFDRIKSTGIYTAKLDLIGANGEKIKKEVKFTIFPYFEIFGGLIGAIILIFVFIKYRKYSRRKMEEKIRKQMEEMMKNKK